MIDAPAVDYSAQFAVTAPTVQCIVRESARYAIPLEVTFALMKTEGGKAGDLVRNTNGTYDMGVMQVNTIWLDEYSKRTGLSKPALQRLSVANGCFSVSLGLDILRRQVDREGSLVGGIAAYHSRTPHVAQRYLERFSRNLADVRRGNIPALAWR